MPWIKKPTRATKKPTIVVTKRKHRRQSVASQLVKDIRKILKEEGLHHEVRVTLR